MYLECRRCRSYFQQMVDTEHSRAAMRMFLAEHADCRGGDGPVPSMGSHVYVTMSHPVVVLRKKGEPDVEYVIENRLQTTSEYKSE